MSNKSRPPRILTTLLALAGMAVVGCDEKEPDEPRKFNPNQSSGNRAAARVAREFPFETTLVRNDGREVRAIIVGKKGDEIIFQLPGKEKRYRILLSELAGVSSSDLRRVDEGEWKPDSQAVKSMRRELERFDEKIAELQAEIARVPTAGVRNRSLARRIEAIEADKVKVQERIRVQQEREFGD